MGRKLKTERNFRKSDPPYFPKENKAYKMNIVVVLLVVSLAAARHPHHRQDAAWTSWTKIGKSYFKVFGTLAETDWDTAENDCESFSREDSVEFAGESVIGDGHLAYDTNDEIHRFLTAAMSGGEGGIWLGANDRDEEGTWKWLDGTAIPSKGHWDESDVKLGLKNAGQNCMQYGWSDNDHWDDVGCDSSKRYACQIDFEDAGTSWTRIGESYFKVFADTFDWDTAKELCAGFSGKVKVAGEVAGDTTGHLAYDTNDEIHRFLTAAMSGGEGGIWLGANDRDEEGTWKWLDGTAIPSKGHWDESDVKLGLKNAGQNCMQYGWSDNDHWDDVGCDSSKRYACQIDFEDAGTSWTRIGESYFKVFADTFDWDTAKELCAGFSGKLRLRVKLPGILLVIWPMTRTT